jgi:hypothetical protein
MKPEVERCIVKSIQKTDDAQVHRDPAGTRNCPRYPFSPPVEVMDIKADIRVIGRLSDIARNGCYIETISPFAERAAVMLTITCDDQSFKTRAKVVHSQIGMGMGLLFTTSEPEQLHVLGSWLTELSGKDVSEQQTPNLVVQPTIPNTTDQELRKIVGELVALLNGKKVLGDSEGMALLRKLSK